MKSVASFLIVHSLLFSSRGIQAGVKPRTDPQAQPRVESKPKWRYPVPARIADGPNKDLFIMTLGEVQPTLADGIYDPLKDEVRLKDGTVKSSYYRDTLGVKYYKPIDKSIFPLPPSGLCTWYYYYQDINETEVKRNAQWIAENLKDYGAQYVQIDDGWQGETKAGRRGNFGLQEQQGLSGRRVRDFEGAGDGAAGFNQEFDLQSKKDGGAVHPCES